jgi:hypothetical protein
VSVKGTFLLSSYRNKALSECSQRSGWYTLEFGMPSSMARGKKVVVLMANYPIAGKPQTGAGKNRETEEEE